MRVRTIKKAFGFLLADIVIIIGIFILQFRTDSSIIEKLGNLQITLANTETEDGKSILKNQFQASYNGLIIAFDDQKPAKLHKGDEKVIQLESWQKKDDLTYQFDFSDSVKLFVGLSSTDSDATLTLHSEVPAGSTLILPFSYGYNTKIQKDDGTRMILDNKKATWEFLGDYENNFISFTSSNPMAMYSAYSDVQKFSFDSIVDLAIADASIYKDNVSAFKNNLINSFKSITVDSSTSEQVIVSYVAAMAERGDYNSAVDSIPQNYRKSSQRTYLSAPYLNNLSDMNNILDTVLTDNANLINRSAVSLSLDIFTVRNMAAFMTIHNNKQNVQTILKNAANADYANTSLAQAVGVIQVYTDLVKYNPEYAALLLPALEGCMERITSSCSLNGNVIIISENDTFLSVIQAIETGMAVLRYGIISENLLYQKAGYALINSYLSETGSFDLRTLSNLYPIIAYDNWYYPHFEKVAVVDGNVMWAWTCAKSVAYNKVASDGINYIVDFPVGYTHYVILRGVPKFRAIYIYDMAFRTDPRFETYNSSGYVYKRESEALLLKSRHKSQKEVIRLELGENPPPAPAAPKPAPAAEPALSVLAEPEQEENPVPVIME